VLPEVEVFLGDVPITKYETPGGQEFADTIIPFVKKTNIIVLANHGTVSFGENVERAYWWTEILDAYCRILMLARQLGNVSYFTEGQERELLGLKQQWGFEDPRNTAEYKNCDICGNDIFRGSWQPKHELSLNTTVKKLTDDSYEVVLSITATAKVEDKTAFIVEVHQAGVFGVN